MQHRKLIRPSPTTKLSLTCIRALQTFLQNPNAQAVAVARAGAASAGSVAGRPGIAAQPLLTQPGIAAQPLLPQPRVAAQPLLTQPQVAAQPFPAQSGFGSPGINVVTSTSVALSNPVSVSTPITQLNGNYGGGGFGATPGVASLPVQPVPYNTYGGLAGLLGK